MPRYCARRLVCNKYAFLDFTCHLYAMYPELAAMLTHLRINATVRVNDVLQKRERLLMVGGKVEVDWSNKHRTFNQETRCSRPLLTRVLFCKLH